MCRGTRVPFRHGALRASRTHNGVGVRVCTGGSGRFRPPARVPAQLRRCGSDDRPDKIRRKPVPAHRLLDHGIQHHLPEIRLTMEPRLGLTQLSFPLVGKLNWIWTVDLRALSVDRFLLPHSKSRRIRVPADDELSVQRLQSWKSNGSQIPVEKTSLHTQFVHKFSTIRPAPATRRISCKAVERRENPAAAAGHRIVTAGQVVSVLVSRSETVKGPGQLLPSRQTDAGQEDING